jgi:hypothetical protein
VGEQEKLIQVKTNYEKYRKLIIKKAQDDLTWKDLVNGLLDKYLKGEVKPD